MPSVTKLNRDDINDIRQAAEQALHRLGSYEHLGIGSSRELVSILDAHLSQLCSASAGSDQQPECDIESLAFEFGSLWGEQLVHALGWQWIRVSFGEAMPEAIGVAAADDSLIVYPFQTIFLYYERILPVRILRSYDVLTEPGRVPMLPPGGLENVMDHIE